MKATGSTIASARISRSIRHDYFDVQTAFGGPRLGHPELSTVVANGGDLQVRGIEFEGVFQVTDGLTLGGSDRVLDIKQTRLAAALRYHPVRGWELWVLTGRSDTTGTLYADYETQTGLWRS